jgi:hypothetical protein
MKLPIVNKSEVIPLRLIPYVTNPAISQRVLLEHLYNPRGDYHPQLFAQSIDNPSVKVDADSWRVLHQAEKEELLPTGMFIWRSDFEGYRQIKVGDYGEIVVLCLSCVIPDEILKDVLEAFKHQMQISQKSSNKETTLKGGAPKGPLAEAVEYAYLKFKEEGNTEILRKGKIHEFLERLKELADEKGNRNFSKYIADRINNVKISPSGCTVTTNEHFLKSSKSRENKIKSRSYRQQDVSKQLLYLRKKYPLPI